MVLIVYYVFENPGFFKRDKTTIESEVFTRINEERLSLGVEKLSRSQYLSDLAYNHSTFMMQTGIFEHSNDGLGENIFYIPVWYFTDDCGPTLTDNQIARCVVRGWTKSPGHYANIKSSAYSVTGVGVYCGLFSCYVTQNFR